MHILRKMCKKSIMYICRGGEIGRHEGLKIPCWQQRAGSTPACGTRIELVHLWRAFSLAARSADHAFCLFFNSLFGALERSLLLWRWRFEPKIALAMTFFCKKVITDSNFVHSLRGLHPILKRFEPIILPM